MAKAKQEKKTDGVIVGNAQGLETALASIEKDLGKEALMVFDEKYLERKYDYQIPSGSIGLDMAIGPMRRLSNGAWVTGLPRGRIVEVIGPESSGKTTLCLHVIANCQSMGGVAAFVDAEHAFDPSYAKKLGVNLKNMLFSQPSSGEEALEIVERLVRSRAVNVIVVDSTAALIPKSELEGDMGDAQMGSQARLMSQAMRKIVSALGMDVNCTVIFINQIRMKVGVMFGNPETTPGGNAVKFYSSIRIDVRKIQTNKTGEVATSNRTRAKVIKNKVAPPFKEAEFDIKFGEGVDSCAELLEWATIFGVIEKSGSWYNMGNVRLGQGTAQATHFIKSDPGLAYKIYDTVLTRHMEQLGYKPDGTHLEGFVPEVAQSSVTRFRPQEFKEPEPSTGESEEDLLDEGAQEGEGAESHG